MSKRYYYLFGLKMGGGWHQSKLWLNFRFFYVAERKIRMLFFVSSKVSLCLFDRSMIKTAITIANFAIGIAVVIIVLSLLLK